MPRIKSAMKAVRVSQRREEHNRSMKTASKTAIAKAEKAIASNDLEVARKEVVLAFSTLDKAAKKKIMHPNTAARRKSRLAKKLAKTAVAGTTASKEPGETKKKKS